MKCICSLFILLLLLKINNAQAQVISCQGHKQASATSLYYSAENLRSDTIDVIKYTINLDITNFAAQKISGNTIVRFAPKLNSQNKIRLDLLKMTIDSIKQNTTLLTYTYNDTVLKANLPLALNTTDTSEITVFYHGTPQGDPAGWGGFSFSGNYAYNLGVGFGAKPHNYGRVWFPCFDNFVEKSLYEFNIITDAAKSSYCNGELMADVTLAGKRTRKWVMNKAIPSYLASVAVADYTQVNWNINAANGNLPVILAARPVDTTALKNGFVHLPNAVLGFESFYGPFVWNRVGYCLVPFSSGAMEHATNIAYPQAAIGNLSYESELMAHELSHHWWGDLMTCETQEDMWLNEGMASYSERLFLEYTYNYATYLAEVKSVHEDMVKYAHLREKGFRAISGVPHEYTYGDHVYRKGADVAHTLRGYMGDAAFFAGLKYVLQQKAYKNMNSTEFRDLLQISSGQNLTDFFNNWVLTGGWPHFSVDSVKTTGTSAPYTSVVYVKQKIFGAPSLYSNVPLELTFMNTAWTKEVKSIIMNGATKSFTLQTNIKPVHTGMNVESKISDAISSEYKTVKATGNANYTLGRASLIISNKGLDSSYIRIEHNFAKPDPIKNNVSNFRLNTQHYWKIDGIISPGFVSKIRFNYDGNKNTSGTSYLDTCLIATNGDSLILLYRKNAADDWREVKHYAKLVITAKTGIVTADTLKIGEYVFANGKSSVVGIDETDQLNGVSVNVFPNPATTTLNVTISNYKLTGASAIEIYDVSGRLVLTKNNPDYSTVISVSELPAGIYKLCLANSGQFIQTTSFVEK
jgi:aminopeptidase N